MGDSWQYSTSRFPLLIGHDCTLGCSGHIMKVPMLTECWNRSHIQNSTLGCSGYQMLGVPILNRTTCPLGCSFNTGDLDINCYWESRMLIGLFTNGCLVHNILLAERCSALSTLEIWTSTVTLGISHPSDQWHVYPWYGFSCFHTAVGFIRKTFSNNLYHGKQWIFTWL